MRAQGTDGMAEAFFAKAAAGGHTSRTHFADPGAGACCQSPFCSKVINRETLASNTYRNFPMRRRRPNFEYPIALRNNSTKLIGFIVGGIAKREEGSTPPKRSMFAHSGTHALWYHGEVQSVQPDSAGPTERRLSPVQGDGMTCNRGVSAALRKNELD